MSLILKQEAANSVPTPPAGKGTIFLSNTDVLTVKLANGSTQGFPTVGGSNTQVFFNDQGALGGNANFTFNKTTGLLTTPLLTVQGNATVDGDLVVNGNITYINVTTFAVEDPIIELGGGPNGNALTSNDGYDRGTLLHYYTSAPVDAFMGWDTSNAEFAMGSNVSVAANVVTFNTLGNLRVGGLKTDNLYYSNGNPWDLQQPAGSNTQLQFNNAGDFGASANLTFDTATNNLTVTGNINATSNVLAQNLNANGVVNATGNISGGNITTGGVLSAIGNVAGGNLNTSGLVSATGNVSGGNITTSGQLVSTKGSGAPIAVSSTSLVANLNADLLDGFNTDGAATANTIPVRNADGNLVANYFIGNGSQLTGIDATSIQNGNSNVKVAANGNVTVSVTGVSNVVVVTDTGVNVTGTLNATGNANVGNLGTGGLIVATGNVSGGNLTTTGALSVTGNANVGNIGATEGVFTTVAGTLTTASQPNITSLGTLTSLAVTGNVTSGNVSGGNLVSANYLTGTLTTAAQPNITSVGSLSSLTVTGNANAGNIGAAAGVFTTIAGSLTTASQPNITSTGTLTSLSVSGNTTSGNVYANSGTIGASLLTGTLTTASQPNVTSLGTLTSASVTGNVTAGNVYANSGTIGASLLTGTLTTAAQPNVTSLGTLSSLVSSGNIQSNANVVTNLIQGRTTGVTITATGTDQNISLVPTGTGTVDVANAKITSVGTPTASTDAATKQYVDDVAQGLNVHDSVQAATPDTLANITSGTITYNNGTGGVNANLVTTGSFNLIDGVNVQTAGTRILVKNQANAVQNGIYTWANSTTIVRATDFNSVPEVEAGDFVFVTGGTLYDNTGWVQTSTVTTIGTDNIDFTQFSGAGTYQAGTGLTLTGSTFSISNTAVTATSYGNGDRVATFTVNNQGQLTAASNVAITANAANLTGTTLNSGIVTSSLTSVGTLGTLNVSGNANVGNIGGSAGVFTTVAGSLTTASQPNVTSLGTLSSLAVSGNASAGNLNTAGKVVASTLESNVATGTAPFTVVSTTQVANLNVATAGTAGTVTTAAQPNITSVGTLTSLGVNGNITAANVTANTGIFTGNGSGLTALNASNISSGTLAQARLANASVTLGSTALTLGSTVTTVAGLSSVTSTTFVGALTGAATTAGTVTTAAQPNITSVGTLSGLTVSSTITGSVSGSAATAGTVTTAAQPNITSVGTLSSLAVSGNVTAGNLYANSGTGGFTTLTASGNITGANVIVSGTTNATSTTTGALTVAGGIGVAGNSYVGNTTVKSNLAYVAPNGANTITSQMLNGGTLAWSGNAGQLFSITDSMSGNIFSVNDVSGIPMIAVDAGGNIYFATSGGYVAYGVTSSITAAGSTQGTATSLTRPINIVSTVSSSTGVVLPATVAGMRMIVVNNGANALNVYPPSGGAINSGATNAAYSQPVGSRIEFIASSTTQWYTLNATFA